MATPIEVAGPDALSDYLETIRRSEMARDDPVYVISVAAELVGVHAQTLRHYERVGLLQPARSDGNIRLYSERDVLRLRAILLLTAGLGINLAGVEAILALRREIDALQEQVNGLEADLRAVKGMLLEDHGRTATEIHVARGPAARRRRR